MEKYSNKTKEQARLIISEHFKSVNYSLMLLLEIEPKEYEEIIVTIKNRDLLLLKKLKLL